MTAPQPVPQPMEPGCASCTVRHGAGHGTAPRGLFRLGALGGGHHAVVALAGNPNTGKSTLFNTLTGLRQHVGNWAGKTVSRSEGSFRFNGRKYKVVDLPGTYSLLSSSTDEEIARDALVFGRPDVTIVVVDATRLERNLNLTLQVLEITDRVVVALNLIDEARRHGIAVDDRHLARELGVPVVATAAQRGEGITELLDAVERVATGEPATRARRLTYPDPEVDRAVRRLEAQLGRLLPHLPARRWVALRLLEGDPGVERALRDGTLARLATRATSEGSGVVGATGSEVVA